MTIDYDRTPSHRRNTSAPYSTGWSGGCWCQLEGVRGLFGSAAVRQFIYLARFRVRGRPRLLSPCLLNPHLGRFTTSAITVPPLKFCTRLTQPRALTPLAFGDALWWVISLIDSCKFSLMVVMLGSLALYTATSESNQVTSGTPVGGGSIFYSLRGFLWGPESSVLMSLTPSNPWTPALSYQAKPGPPGTCARERFDRLVRTLVVP